METLKFLMTSTFYPPYHIGGDAVHVNYLAEELARRGHEVHVMFSMDAYRLKRKDRPQGEKVGKVQLHPLVSPYGRLSPMKAYTFGNSKFILKQYRKLVEDKKPDIVHHHNISLLGHDILKKMGSYRQIYTAHDYWLVCQRNDLMRKGVVCTERLCNSCAVSSLKPPQTWRKGMKFEEIDCVICPSQYMKSKLSNLDRPTVVIPNFVPKPPDEIGKVSDSGYFLYLGVLEPHKGIRELIKAFTKNNQRLKVAGKGSLSEFVSREIEQHGVGHRIEYMGWTEDKWAVIKGACAMILPSLWPENSPLSVLEAMSVGTPTFCTDLGGAREIVERVSTDFIIPVNSLVERLMMIQPPKENRANVTKVYSANYSPEKYMDRYLAITGGGTLST